MKAPDWLNSIVSNPRLELEWIDLLSQLEFVGCRKIIKAHPYEGISLSVLQHLTEEASHAFLMKRVAESEGLEARSWADGLFASAGWEYFQQVDRNIAEVADVAYPAVSWAVERRVLWLYPVYSNATKRPAVQRVLAQILAQEKRHGKQFEDLPVTAEVRQRMVAIEEKHWEGLEDRVRSLIRAFESDPHRWRLH